MERAVLTAQDRCIHHYDLPPALQYRQETGGVPGAEGSKAPLDVLMAEYERDLIIQALRRNKGNCSAAGRELGLSPRVISYRMSRLRIKPE